MGLLEKIANTFRSTPTGAVPDRNDPCWCGSGKKYKRCCLDRDRERAQARGKSCAAT